MFMMAIIKIYIKIIQKYSIIIKVNYKLKAKEKAKSNVQIKIKIKNINILENKIKKI